MRLSVAPRFFIACAEKKSGEVVGFVNGTLTSAEQLPEESMSTHEEV